MPELARIRDQVRRVFEGEAWYGPSILEVVADLHPEESHVKLAEARHSIGEHLLHMLAWRRMVVERLKGNDQFQISEKASWPSHSSDERAWMNLLEDFKRNQEDLLDVLEPLDGSLLNECMPGTSTTWYITLHGILQHDLFHLGQIWMIKKALRARSAAMS
jgi:uncharacterized damage-inducible protein DinB